MINTKHAADQTCRFLVENGYDPVACARMPIMATVMLGWVNGERDDATTLQMIEKLDIIAGGKLKK